MEDQQPAQAQPTTSSATAAQALVVSLDRQHELIMDLQQQQQQQAAAAVAGNPLLAWQLQQDTQPTSSATAAQALVVSSLDRQHEIIMDLQQQQQAAVAAGNPLLAWQLQQQLQQNNMTLQAQLHEFQMATTCGSTAAATDPLVEPPMPTVAASSSSTATVEPPTAAPSAVAAGPAVVPTPNSNPVLSFATATPLQQQQMMDAAIHAAALQRQAFQLHQVQMQQQQLQELFLRRQIEAAAAAHHLQQQQQQQQTGTGTTNAHHAHHPLEAKSSTIISASMVSTLASSFSSEETTTTTGGLVQEEDHSYNTAAFAAAAANLRLPAAAAIAADYAPPAKKKEKKRKRQTNAGLLAGPGQTSVSNNGNNKEMKKNKKQQTSSKKELKWRTALEDLQKYKDRHGDCIVPRGYAVNPRLASWVAEQRKQYKLFNDNKRSSITQERINLLEKMGFAWNAQVAAWERRLKELEAFKDEHGHCHVPLNHTDPKLGLWVKEQRRHYALLRKGQPSHMTEDRAMKLDDIGFCWDTNEATWLERLRELKAYKDEFGHCLVPTYWDDNPKLSTWVHHQRRQYKKYMEGRPCHITKSRIALLNDVGISWPIVKKKRPKSASDSESSASDSDNSSDDGDDHHHDEDDDARDDDVDDKSSVASIISRKSNAIAASDSD